MRRGRHTELYNALGVSFDATDEDIKRAFRRLALQYHPDKAPGQEEHFQRINYAYNILSLPVTRRLYDRHGDLGLALHSTVKSETIVEALLNTSRLRWLVIALIIILLLVALLPSLVALKVAGMLSGWSWTRLALPLWFLDLYIAVLGGAFFRLVWNTVRESGNSGTAASFFERGPASSNSSGIDGRDEETGNASDGDDSPNLDKLAFSIAAIALAVIFSLIVLQQLLVVLRLDRGGWVGRWSWWSVLSPVLAYQSLRLVYHGASTAYVLRKWDQTGAQVTDQVEYRLPGAKFYYAFVRLRWLVMHWCCLVLLLLRIGHGWNSISWTAVATPFYLISIAAFIIDYRFALRREQLLVTGTSRRSTSSVLGEEESPTSIRVSHIYYAVYGVLLMYLLLAVLLINARLMGWAVSWTLALLPLHVASLALELVIAIGGVLVYSLVNSAFSELKGTHNSQRSLEWMRQFGYALGSPLQRSISSGH